MVVSNEQYFESIRMLRVCSERDDYIEQSLALPVWKNTDKDELKQYLEVLYDAAHRNVADVAKSLGYTLRQFALRLGFHYNTLFAWSKGNLDRSYAEYILIQEFFGLIKIPRE